MIFFYSTKAQALFRNAFGLTDITLRRDVNLEVELLRNEECSNEQ